MGNFSSSNVKPWHGFIVAALLLVVGLGIGLSQKTEAVASSERETGRAARQNLPAEPVGASGRVRPVQRGAGDFSSGIDLGPNVPLETPGVSSQPVPKFSGLDTPWLLNADGPLEVPDDSIFHGLMDVRGGLINNDPSAISLAGGGRGAPGGGGGGGGGGGPQLTIALADDTLGTGTVSRGTSPNVTKINFTASGGDITVTQIRVTRGGNATENDIFTTCFLDGTTALACPVINDAEAGRPTTYTAIVNSTIQAGQTKTLTLQAGIQGSATVGRTFTLGIAAATDVTVQTGTVTGSATGNTFTITAPPPPPPPPTVILTVGSPNINETDGATLVTATLSATSAQPVTVTLGKSGTASDVTDYALTETIVIPAGNLFGSVTLSAVNDIVDELNETVIIDIGTVTNGTESGTQQQTVTINDDDPAPAPPPPPAQPDLRISSLTPSNATPNAGTSITLSGTVYNGGDADATQPFVRFCLDNPNCLNNTTKLIYEHGLGTTVPKLTTRSISTTWPVVGGNHTIYFCADVTPSPLAAISESNEENNCSSTAVNVTVPTLILTRNPIPAAGGSIGTGSNIPILEFDAHTNTGTARISRIYVTHNYTGNASGVMSNIRLQRLRDDGTWTDLAINPSTSDADPGPAVRNTLDFTIRAGHPHSYVSTTIVKLRITANISCIAAAASVDYTIFVGTDVQLESLTAGMTVQLVPAFTPIPRNIPLCTPAPPPPPPAPPWWGSGSPAATKANSVLHNPAISLGVADFGANSVLGAIPAAQAAAILSENTSLRSPGAGGPAGVTIQGITLYNPVTIYDDLWVRGSGNAAREPGNLVVTGIVQSTGNIQTAGNLHGARLNVGAGLDLRTTATQHQITGNLQINPGDGGVDIVGGDLSVTGGGITANSIGRFNPISSADIAVTGTAWTAGSANCPDEDILVSCNSVFASDPPLLSAWFSTVSGNTCTLKARKTGAATNFTANALAICFSPNG